MKKQLQTNQTQFRVVKAIRKMGDKLYVKWKGYDNSFNCWMDKKDNIMENELLSRTRQSYQKQNKNQIRFFLLCNKI